MGAAPFQVNDENTLFLDSISTHAGLWGNIDSVARWCEWFLSENQGETEFKKNLVKFKNKNPGRRFYQGFDTPSGPIELSQAGANASQYVVGHLGFTGTSVWMDLESQRYGVLLSNRTFSGDHRRDSLDLIRKLRRRFFSLLWQKAPIQTKIELWGESLKELWLPEMKKNFM